MLIQVSFLITDNSWKYQTILFLKNQIYLIQKILHEVKYQLYFISFLNQTH
jgi:hypothetical protein